MPSASERNVRPAVAPALTSSGVVRTVAPMTPTRTPLTLNTAERSSHAGGWPVAVSTMFADRNGKSAFSRCSRMRGMPKSNSWLPYDVASMPHAFSTSIAGRSLSSADSGGDAPTLSPAASSNVSPGSAAASSSNIVARSAAPPTRIAWPSMVIAVSASWPWKSLSPMRLTTL